MPALSLAAPTCRSPDLQSRGVAWRPRPPPRARPPHPGTRATRTPDASRSPGGGPVGVCAPVGAGPRERLWVRAGAWGQRPAWTCPPAPHLHSGQGCAQVTVGALGPLGDSVLQAAGSLGPESQPALRCRHVEPHLGPGEGEPWPGPPLRPTSGPHRWLRGLAPGMPPTPWSSALAHLPSLGRPLARLTPRLRLASPLRSPFLPALHPHRAVLSPSHGKGHLADTCGWVAAVGSRDQPGTVARRRRPTGEKPGALRPAGNTTLWGPRPDGPPSTIPRGLHNSVFLGRREYLGVLPGAPPSCPHCRSARLPSLPPPLLAGSDSGVPAPPWWGTRPPRGGAITGGGWGAPWPEGASVHTASPVTVTVTDKRAQRRGLQEPRTSKDHSGHPPWRASPEAPLAYLPGLQLEAQAQLRVVDGGVPPQLGQGRLEVGQGLLVPAGAGRRGPSVGKGAQLHPHVPQPRAPETPAGGVAISRAPPPPRSSQGVSVATSGVWGGVRLWPSSAFWAPPSPALSAPRPPLVSQLCPGQFPPAPQAPHSLLQGPLPTIHPPPPVRLRAEPRAQHGAPCGARPGGRACVWGGAVQRRGEPGGPRAPLRLVSTAALLQQTTWRGAKEGTPAACAPAEARGHAALPASHSRPGGGGPQGRRSQGPHAHLSSWKLATPRWKKPTARYTSLATA